MNKKNIVLLSFLLPFALNSATENNSLCRSNEQTLFTCPTKSNKIASICASKNLSATSGYMQYRFGQPQNIELSYPSEQTPPNKAFMGRSQMFSGGGGIYLRFSKNNDDYILYSGIGKGWEINGIILLQNGKFISYIPCINQPISEITPQQLENLNIPHDPDNQEFFPGDIPQNKTAARLNQSTEELKKIKACYDKAVTTVDMKACANSEYTFYDNLLNKQYNALLGILSKTNQNLFIDTQKAWLSYRKKECDFESLQNKGGTLQPLSLIECYTSFNKKRVAKFNELIQLYQN